MGKMKYTDISENLINLIGGKDNITFFTHCVTRLRFNLKDESLAETDEIESLEGVVGTKFSNGQLQVIIGPNVDEVYEEVLESNNLDNLRETNTKDKSEESSEEKPSKNQGFSFKTLFSKILDFIIGSFSPIIPVITMAGMLKAILILIITVYPNASDSSTYSIFSTIADATYYFLPILLAYTSSLKIKSNPYIAVVMAGIMLHPNFQVLRDAGEKSVAIFGLSARLVNYSSSVIPILFAVVLIKYVDKFSKKVVPKFLEFFLRPLLTISIVTPIVLIFLGPIGITLGDYMAQGILLLDSKAGWIAVALLSSLMPFIILTGMHQSLRPINLQILLDPGYDKLILPSMLMSNMAQSGAGFSVSFKTKNKDLKILARTTASTALLGITEPVMYGVNLKLKRPMIGAMIGSFCGGLYGGIFGIQAIALATAGLLALPIFIGKAFIHTIIAMIISFSVSFVMTYVIGFIDEKN